MTGKADDVSEKRPCISYTVHLDDWHPTTLNELIRLRHWGQRKRRKEADMAHLMVACQNARIPKAKGKRRLSLVWHLPKGGKRRDEDNVFKTLNDCLVVLGMLKNDSPVWLERGGIEYRREGRKGLTVILEETA